MWGEAVQENLVSLPEKISPFSVLNNYRIIQRTKKIREILSPTPREIILLNILKSCGSVAGFQVEGLWSNKGREKLKKLAFGGFIVLSKLEGEYKLNVYSLSPQKDVSTVLKQLAFAQLYMRIREHFPCGASLLPPPLTGVINIRGKIFPVLVVRRGEDPACLYGYLKGLPRLLVIAEELVKLDLPVPFRVTTDGDLLEKPLRYAFYDENGRPDEANIFK
ncbi:hypothetical protein Desku_0897 [Desulfofundulus kuznetsovii DSM 6115]|uniref:Uncharacterized protein n=1 Tax=Desulfofundulus kuznetsovii (strain DSM 6115 / VKM B-1805 / 17) TaxID=760568 RepID=A0AAU8PBK4_DESK7|nr:hypothetical protein Desku_0897 [Desulfofundulus kuznetsovii DSM 6115]